MVNLMDDAAFGPGKVEHPRSYFEERDISIDCRGPVQINSLSQWGLHIRTYTMGHNPEHLEQAVYRPLVVEPYAWICSDVVLYNCTIGTRAVVAVGSVVRSHDVPPYTMVEGNPARIIARYVDGGWYYLDHPEPSPRTKGWKGKWLSSRK